MKKIKEVEKLKTIKVKLSTYNLIEAVKSKNSLKLNTSYKSIDLFLRSILEPLYYD